MEDEEADRVYFDLIAHIQREQVTSLQTDLPILRWKELCVEMRNLTHSDPSPRRRHRPVHVVCRTGCP